MLTSMAVVPMMTMPGLALLYGGMVRKKNVLAMLMQCVAITCLVAITPASGFVLPNGAMVIGAIAGVVCFLSATALKKAIGYDDSLDAFGVHCIGGIVGALLTGAFVSKACCGSDSTVLTPLWGVGTTLIYGFVMSLIILQVIDLTIGLRVTPEGGREGLDVALHGERVE